MYFSSIARDGLKDRDLCSHHLYRSPATKKTNKLYSELRLCVCLGLVPIQPLAMSSWQIWDYKSTYRGSHIEMLPPILPNSSFSWPSLGVFPSCNCLGWGWQTAGWQVQRFKSGAAQHCFGHHIYPLCFNIPAQELHYFPALRGRWENPFNTVEQIKMLDEYRSLSSFWL